MGYLIPKTSYRKTIMRLRGSLYEKGKKRNREILKHKKKKEQIDDDKRNKLWFGLVSLFNGISTSVDYLMPKPFS